MSGATETKRPAQKPVTGAERDALMRLNIAYDILLETAAALKDRARLIPYAARDLAMIRAKISRIMEAVAYSIPKEQRTTYNNNLRMASYTIGVKGPATGKPRNDAYGMWISWNELNALLEGCHDHCLTCQLDKYETRRCPIRKALDVIPNDVPRSEDGECPYMMVM